MKTPYVFVKCEIRGRADHDHLTIKPIGGSLGNLQFDIHPSFLYTPRQEDGLVQITPNITPAVQPARIRTWTPLDQVCRWALEHVGNKTYVPFRVQQCTYLFDIATYIVINPSNGSTNAEAFFKKCSDKTVKNRLAKKIIKRVFDLKAQRNG